MTANETARERAICGPCLTLGAGINLSSPTMSPGPALALSVVSAAEVEWAAAFDMVRGVPRKKCPEYSVHQCRTTTPGGQYYSSYSLIILIVGDLP